MTESEWLASTDPEPMLAFLRDQGTVSDRKLRLFAVACCRRNWNLLREDVSRPGLEVIEPLADNLATLPELEEVHRAARAQGREFEKLRQWRLNSRGPSWETDAYYRESQQARLVAHASQTSDFVGMLLIETTTCKLLSAGFRLSIDKRNNDNWQLLCTADRADLVCLLSDIVANPFRPVTLDPKCLTATVVSLAAGIYEERAWERMGALADALEDVGCGEGPLLDHLRGPGPHVRGCWAVDLLLGME